LTAFDLPETIDPDAAARPWQWPPAWMNAAWQRGVGDLLDWVLGDRPDAPITGRTTASSPTVYDLTYEEAAAADVAAQGRVGPPVDPAHYPPPQYGEAIQATIAWLRGESTVPPVNRSGKGPYATATELSRWRGTSGRPLVLYWYLVRTAVGA
jgi:hypothetical protein